ncbi:MAG TPA: sulfatase-like hydrolase/transferase [Bryobacteraceae bacterium]|nr:sulfatase-like hydrolase/transferase [Bryobacteraceae bacterium]
MLTRRTFLQSGAIAAAPPTPRPNILFLMADQFRYDCLGVNGNRQIRTPNLDRLAARSMNFGNAFVQSPVCVPSRVSYFTGRYAHSHKNRVNYTPCDPREVFLQRMLHDAGYQTGSVGKLHFYPPTVEHAESTGFDRVLLHDGVGSTDPYSDYVKWRQAHDPNASIPYTALAKDVPPGKNPFRAAIPYEFSPTHWTGTETCRMLREFCAAQRPFYLLASFFKPHSPFQTPTPYDAMYDGADIPLPRRVTLDDIHKLPLPVQKLILRGRPEYATDPKRLEWMYRSYYAAVSMVDCEIGKILEELERSGRARDTIVFFATDHGAQLLEHGLMDKNVFFEASVHVPFLASFPGRIAPGRRHELIEMVDVLPSILELCGLPVPDRVQGRSFAPLVTSSGAGYTPREVVFSENIIPEVITGGRLNMPFVPGKGVAGIRHPDAKMVRSRRWKLNYYPGYGAELYDLENDPGEEQNLIGNPAYTAAISDFKQAILDWMITADENDQIARRWLLS